MPHTLSKIPNTGQDRTLLEVDRSFDDRLGDNRSFDDRLGDNRSFDDRWAGDNRLKQPTDTLLHFERFNL